MANAFLDIFKNLGDTSLKSSFFKHDDAPSYSLLSEGLEDDGETSPFSTNNPEDPISEVTPAENVAQKWERQSNELKHAGPFSTLYSNWAGNFTPKDAWDKQFQPQTSPLGKPEAETKLTGFARRLDFADRHNLSGNDYLQAFGTINAHAKSAVNNDIHRQLQMDHAY